jgi:uncharacterized protein YndB with AHSA1/START domain
MADPVTVETTVNAPLDQVWERWTRPEHVTKWNFASGDWECPTAENDLRVGGSFSARMQAKDGSMGFDMAGTYTAVEEQKLIEFDMGDARHVKVEFAETPEGVRIVETFDPEGTYPIEYQRAGWQAILDNFKKYAEGR